MLHERDGPGTHRVPTTPGDHWDTNPPPAVSELCWSRAVPEWDCDDISAGEGPPVSTTLSPRAAVSTLSPPTALGLPGPGQIPDAPRHLAVFRHGDTLIPRQTMALAQPGVRSLPTAPCSGTLWLPGNTSWGQEGCCSRPDVPPCPISCHTLQSGTSLPGCPECQPRVGTPALGAELGLS